MIDSIETLIQWLASELPDVKGNVAAKHRYGTGWQAGESGISVHEDGGAIDLYAAVQNPRVELRLYGSSTVAVKAMHNALIAVSRAQERVVVATSQGNALVHYFLPESGLSLVYDETLQMDLGVVFFKAMISEEAVL